MSELQVYGQQPAPRPNFSVFSALTISTPFFELAKNCPENLRTRVWTPARVFYGLFVYFYFTVTGSHANFHYFLAPLAPFTPRLYLTYPVTCAGAINVYRASLIYRKSKF